MLIFTYFLNYYVSLFNPNQTIPMKQLILVLCLAFLHTVAAATHIMGGFITYTKDTGPNPNPRKLFYTLTLITDRHSQADEPVARINMGDGIFLDVPRTNLTQISPDYIRMEFSWDYTYGADGTYTASWTGINRNPGIQNVAHPSDRVSMFIMTTVNISTLKGPNSSPQFLAPELIPASIGQPLHFNLLAHDPEDDSLVYKVVAPMRKTFKGFLVALLGNTTSQVPGYSLPDKTYTCQRSTGNGTAKFNLDSRTGQVTWDAPCKEGDYVIAVAVEQWKGNLKLGQVIYDMTIRVTDNQGKGITLGNANKLNFTPAGYIEAKANQELELKINYSQLSQAKAPLPARFDNPAIEEYFASELSQVFNAPVTYTLENTATGIVGTFRFTPDKSLIRDKPYFVSFYGLKAQDPSTTSFGIVIRDAQPQLKLIGAEKLRRTAENHFIASPLVPLKLKVLAEYYPGYDVTINAKSSLAETATQFTFTTHDSTAGKIGEIMFRPDDAQVSTVPKLITFKATYTAEGATPIIKELQIQVIVTNQSPKELEAAYLIYPNQVESRFTVQADAPAILSIYTLQGKLIHKQQLQAGTTEVNRPAATSGLYFYTFTTQSGYKKTGKLVLQ